MNNKLRNYVNIGIITALVSACFYLFSSRTPNEVTTELYQEIQEKSNKISNLERELSKKVRELKNRKKTVTKVITRPDGTIEKVTEKEEESSKVYEEISDKEKQVSEETNESESSTEVKVTEFYSNYALGILYRVRLDQFSSDGTSLFDWHNNTSVLFGKRIGKTPFKWTVESSLKFNQYAAGLLWEF